MVFKIRQKSIAQLKREIAQQERAIKKAKTSPQRDNERIVLQKKLFALKNRKLIIAGKKAKVGSIKVGKAVLKAGKVIGPALSKQAKLIKQQQLRDDAIARKVAKRTKIQPKKKRKRTSSQGQSLFGNLDF